MTGFGCELPVYRLVSYLSNSTYRSGVESILRQTSADLSFNYKGKNLSYYAAAFGMLELLKYFENDLDIPRRVEGMDALEYILRSPYVTDYEEMIRYLVDTGSSVEDSHIEIVHLYQEFEPEKFKFLESVLDNQLLNMD